MEEMERPPLDMENPEEADLKKTRAELNQIENFSNGIRHGIRQNNFEMVNEYLTKLLALEIVSQIAQESLASDLEILHRFCSGIADKEQAYEASHNLERTIIDFLMKRYLTD